MEKSWRKRENADKRDHCDTELPVTFRRLRENGGSEENVSTETAGQKVSEENSGMGQADAGMEFCGTAGADRAETDGE